MIVYTKCLIKRMEHKPKRGMSTWVWNTEIRRRFWNIGYFPQLVHIICGWILSFVYGEYLKSGYRSTHTGIFISFPPPPLWITIFHTDNSFNHRHHFGKVLLSRYWFSSVSRSHHQQHSGYIYIKLNEDSILYYTYYVYMIMCIFMII